MKRILSLVCVTALLLLVLAACGATEESTSRIKNPTVRPTTCMSSRWRTPTTGSTEP